MALAAAAHGKLQRCFDRALRDLAGGNGTSAAAARCMKALDPSDPDSPLARARARLLAQLARKCERLTAADLGRPCNSAATTALEVADCTLDRHALAVAQMIAVEYRDACAILTALGLEHSFPLACVEP